MSVNYSLSYMLSKPGKKDSQRLYYAKAQATGEITIDELAEDIAYATSLTDGDVLNVLRSMVKQTNKHLAAGKIVRWENFGSFQVQIQSSGAETPKEFTSANIKSVSIQFRPGNFIKAVTRAGAGGLSFHRVAGLKSGTPSDNGENDNETGGSGNDGNGSGSETENPLG